MSFKIPLLIISFNRPKLIYKQLNFLKNLAPLKLYIFSDGPRANIYSDIDKVNKCRFFFKNKINWQCDKYFKFEIMNKGCGLGVSEAITWFFKNEKEGIILEDDCFLSKSFFSFAEAMLEKYRFDYSIAGITADYKLSSSKTSKYGFIPYPLIWGWATWRRSWDGYSFNLEDFNKKELSGYVKSLPKNQKKYWISNFEKIKNSDIPHTWDFQYSYLVMKRNQNFIHPFTNLVSNQGFNSDATHTKNPFDKFSNLDLGLIIKPYEADIKTTKYANYLSKNLFVHKSFIFKIFIVFKNWIKAIFINILAK